jgi:hypothetical protein
MQPQKQAKGELVWWDGKCLPSGWESATILINTIAQTSYNPCSSVAFNYPYHFQTSQSILWFAATLIESTEAQNVPPCS